MPPCNDCGADLLFVKTHDGNSVPVERNTPVFAVHMDEHSNFRAARVDGHRALGDEKAAYMALHVCPKKGS
jgi:hypothetical protein